MRAIAGQAARAAGGRLHTLGQLLLALLLFVLAAAAALLWRLDQGPLELPFLARRIEQAAAQRGIALHVGDAALSWGGFSGGVGAPLHVTLQGLAASNQPLHVATLEAGFSLGSLLAGNFVPASLAVDGVRAEVHRSADGRLAFGTRPTSGAPPPAAGGAGFDWRRLRHVTVHDVRISGFDAPTGIAWQVDRADIDLIHRNGDALSGSAALALAAGQQHATLLLVARPDGTASRVAARLSPIDPASLAGLSPALAPANLLDAPVLLAADATLRPDLSFAAARLSATVGSGTVHAGTGTAPVLGAGVQAELSPDGADATLHLETAARPEAKPTHVTGTLHAARAAAGWQAALHMALDQAAFADLPVLWPAGTGGHGTRPWITQNITEGVATDGTVDATLAAPPDLSDVSLPSLKVAIAGHGLTVWWLRPVPPIVDGEVLMTMTNPNDIDIAVSSARQSTGQGEGVAYSHGLIKVRGINDPDQIADIATDLSGNVADLLTVLKNKRVQLLDKRPVPMKNPAGTFTAHLTVDHLLLRDDVKMDDLQIATKAHFEHLHLGGIAGGRDLDRGSIDMAANDDGLQASGTALLAGIDSSLRVAMDFRSGKPSDIIQDVTVSGTADEHTFAQAGMDVGDVLRGPVALRARLRTQRGGHADVSMEADANRAAVRLPQIGYEKAANQPLHADVALAIDGDRLTAIDSVHVQGTGIALSGGAEMANGRPDLVRFDAVSIGRTQAHGAMRLPRRPGDPYVLTLSGPVLDASGPIKTDTAKDRKPVAKKTDGTPFVADAKFDRVLLGHGHELLQAAAHAESNGTLIRTAQLTGLAQSVSAAKGERPQPFQVTLAPEGSGRRLVARTPDAGGLLSALGVADDVQGGRMAITAHYDDTMPDPPLTGSAELNDFRVLDAPAIGRILQGATLYGLIEVLRGPGLGFLRAVVPFRWAGSRLTLSDARAYSASLGLTAKGDVDLGANTLDLTGTVVPFYAINTLPGRIPLIGKLFSPEKSGGLFAATYALRGPTADPKVSVNPLATVTPGVLRKLFNLF